MKNTDAKVITFSIFKGGTGKTTSAVNNSVALAKKKQRVLLEDLDHQVSATRHLGIDPEPLSPNLYDVYVQKVLITIVVKKPSHKSQSTYRFQEARCTTG